MDKAVLESCLDSSMPVGQSKRYSNCPFCGKCRDAFVVTMKSHGWVFLCHKCHAKGFRPVHGRAPSKVKTLLNQTSKTVRDVRLPPDFTLDIPTKGVEWLATYGITEEDRKKFRIGYSALYDRVIIPVFTGEKLVYWQGRNLGKVTKTNPKYLNVSSNRELIWFELLDKPNSPVILVEDVLSAIKVWKAGYNAISVLGSSISDRLLAKLIRHKPPRVVVWLDPDKRKDSVRFSRRLSAFGIKCGSLLLPTLDPKDYSLEEINQYIDT